MTVGIACIIPPFIGISLFWNYIPYLSFYLWLITAFYLILFTCGIFNLIQGVRSIKAARENKRFISSPFYNIVNFFLIIILIGSPLFYIYYTETKEWNYGPYLSWTDEDSSKTMTITWITEAAEPNPIFKWGDTSYDLSKIANVEGDDHHHTVKLKGLKPDSNYFYQIPGFREIITEFRTGPRIGSRTPFSFVLYGDTREDEPSESELTHEEIIERMGKEKDVRFVLQAGDVANNYDENWKEQWHYNFEVIKPLSKKIPFMSVAGNHGWNEGVTKTITGSIYINYYELPRNGPGKDGESYYFNYGNAFYLVIGYDQQEAASPEEYDAPFVEWVVEQLQYAKTCGLFDWIFVMFHKPPFSVKIENNVIEENHTQIRYWHPIFMDLGVDFVFNGHNHHYERIQVGNSPEEIGTHNITYVVSGGGGGGGDLHDTLPAIFNSSKDGVGDLEYYGKTAYAEKCYHYVRFSVQGNTISLKTITVSGEVIDRYTVTK